MGEEEGVLGNERGRGRQVRIGGGEDPKRKEGGGEGRKGGWGGRAGREGECKGFLLSSC